MFSWFKKPVVVAAVAAPTENVIAKGTRVRGDIEAELGFRIDGSVDGTVVSRGVVTIGEDGELLGNVRATSVVVLGHVEGDVVCEGHLEIGPNGRIVGDVTMKSFQIQNGGVFAGTSRMAMPDGVKALSAAPPKMRTLPPPAHAAVPPQAPPQAVPPHSSRARLMRPTTDAPRSGVVGTGSGELPRAASGED